MLELNKIYCGDCVQIMRQMPDNCIDLTVTSPPYDNLRDYKGYSFTFSAIATELYRITKSGGIVVWVVGDQTKNGSESLSSFKQAIYFVDNCGFKLHDTMIYEKSAFANPSKNRYHQMFEYMFVFTKGKIKTFNPLIDRKNKTQYNFGKQRRRKDGGFTNVDTKSRIKLSEYGMRWNIWRYATSKGVIATDEFANLHPAIFPEKLAEDHILSWSNPGDLVLDPMCGSGTTCKMAMLNNRNYIGIDISQEYVDLANKRLENSR